MPSAPLVSRRATVTGAALLGVAGCSAATDATPAARTTARAGGSPTALDSDEAIVSDLVARLNGSIDLVTSVRRRYPGSGVRPLLAVQQAHAATLRAAVTASRLRVPTTTSSPVAGTRDAALAQVREAATALQQACLDAAVRAESGAFARLLASMGCALSQQLQVLPRG